jgi:hypothetical protein
MGRRACVILNKKKFYLLYGGLLMKKNQRFVFVLLLVLFSGVIFNVDISAQNNDEQLELDQSLIENYESTILANKILSQF